MKKMLFCIICLLVSFCMMFVGCNSTPKANNAVLITVNGVAIYEDQISARIKINEIRNNAFNVYISQTFSNESERNAQLQKVLQATDEQGVKYELIKAEVVRQYLSKTDSVISFEQTKEMTNNEFKLLKEDATQATFYNNLKMAIESYGINEDIYMEMSYSLGYDFYNINKAKSVFKGSANYFENNEKSLDEQFNEFIDNLVKEAAVEISK